MNGDSEVYRDTDAFLEKDSHVDNDTENLGSAGIARRQPKRNLQPLLFLVHLLLLLLYTCIFYFYSHEDLMRVWHSGFVFTGWGRGMAAERRQREPGGR